MKSLIALLLFGIATMTATAQERTIFKEAVVEESVATVWKTWTTKEGLESFFAPEAIVDPRPDGALGIHFDPYAQKGLKGADDMRVLAVQENRLFSFTWNAPPQFKEVRPQRTIVAVRMESLGEKRTRVTISHMGWGTGGEWDQVYAYFDRAWAGVLGNFQKRFKEGPIDWKPWLERLKK